MFQGGCSFKVPPETNLRRNSQCYIMRAEAHQVQAKNAKDSAPFSPGTNQGERMIASVCMPQMIMMLRCSRLCKITCDNKNSLYCNGNGKSSFKFCYVFYIKCHKVMQCSQLVKASRGEQCLQIYSRYNGYKYITNWF